MASRSFHLPLVGLLLTLACVLAINGTGFKVLNEGDIISYDTEERAKGIVAVNVNLIQPNPNPPRRRTPRVRVPIARSFLNLHLLSETLNLNSELTQCLSLTRLLAAPS